MNSIVIKGRITKDLELKAVGDGKEVLNFSVAVDRRFGKEEKVTDFFNCQAWGKAGVFIQAYFKKGQEILLHGAMQCRKWQDSEGKSRETWDLVVDQAEFCGSKKDNIKVDGAVNAQSALDGFQDMPEKPLPF